MIDVIIEFFKSELAKSHPVMAGALVVLFIALGALLMWIYMKYFYAKDLEIRNKELFRDNEELKQQLQSLDDDFTALRQRHDFLVTKSKELNFYDDLFVSRNVDESNKALDEFVNNN